MQNRAKAIRVDFSGEKVFFVVVGAIVGALIMIIPKTIVEVGMGLPYYLTWIARSRKHRACRCLKTMDCNVHVVVCSYL